MRRERHLRHRAQIIDPVQMWVERCRVVAAQQEVNRVGLARAQRVCEGFTDPGGSSGGAQRVEVADLVQSDVAFDVFSELDGVACEGGSS